MSAFLWFIQGINDVANHQKVCFHNMNLFQESVLIGSIITSQDFLHRRVKTKPCCTNILQKNTEKNMCKDVSIWLIYYNY